MYATKRRRRNVKNYKHPPKENQKSNPSKRHRERLNAELENLASLLPFEQTILTKLDKLSILRLAVSYLRIKSYFQANLLLKNHHQYAIDASIDRANKLSHVSYLDPNFSEGNAILESLNGFILIVNTNSEVFYASRTVENYIGFHQSDIIHQSVFELIHSEDREEFKKHLSWNSKLPADKTHLTLNEVLSNKDLSKYLERNFTVRFRCLLDNTSGFLTLDIVGRLGVLHGQKTGFQVNANGEVVSTVQTAKSYNKGKNSKMSAAAAAAAACAAAADANARNGSSEEPLLALFAIACPFGPPSLFELPQRESLFKTKHKISLSPISIDAKGKIILGYSDGEFVQLGGYDLIHPDDLKYYANAHKELLKTGSCGLICYRLMTSSKTWQWLQTSMRIIYKSNKPEFIIGNHRPLTNEEGEELYYKRGCEFKLPYPCLYDFESVSFGSSMLPNASQSSAASVSGVAAAAAAVNNGHSESSSSSASTPTSSKQAPIQPESSTPSSNQASHKQPTKQPTTPSASSSSSNPSTSNKSVSHHHLNNSTTAAPSTNTSGQKTKSSKQNKAQLIQQRAQQHAQNQMLIQQQQQQQQQQPPQYQQTASVTLINGSVHYPTNHHHYNQHYITTSSQNNHAQNGASYISQQQQSYSPHHYPPQSASTPTNSQQIRVIKTINHSINQTNVNSNSGGGSNSPKTLLDSIIRCQTTKLNRFVLNPSTTPAPPPQVVSITSAPMTTINNSSSSKLERNYSYIEAMKDTPPPGSTGLVVSNKPIRSGLLQTTKLLPSSSSSPCSSSSSSSSSSSTIEQATLTQVTQQPLLHQPQLNDSASDSHNNTTTSISDVEIPIEIPIEIKLNTTSTSANKAVPPQPPATNLSKSRSQSSLINLFKTTFSPFQIRKWRSKSRDKLLFSSSSSSSSSVKTATNLGVNKTVLAATETKPFSNSSCSSSTSSTSDTSSSSPTSSSSSVAPPNLVSSTTKTKPPSISHLVTTIKNPNNTTSTTNGMNGNSNKTSLPVNHHHQHHHHHNHNHQHISRTSQTTSPRNTATTTTTTTLTATIVSNHPTQYKVRAHHRPNVGEEMTVALVTSPSNTTTNTSTTKPPLMPTSPTKTVQTTTTTTTAASPTIHRSPPNLLFQSASATAVPSTTSAPNNERQLSYLKLTCLLNGYDDPTVCLQQQPTPQQPSTATATRTIRLNSTNHNSMRPQKPLTFAPGVQTTVQTNPSNGEFLKSSKAMLSTDERYYDIKLKYLRQQQQQQQQNQENTAVRSPTVGALVLNPKKKQSSPPPPIQATKQEPSTNTTTSFSLKVSVNDVSATNSSIDSIPTSIVTPTTNNNSNQPIDHSLEVLPPERIIAGCKPSNITTTTTIETTEKPVIKEEEKEEPICKEEEEKVAIEAIKDEEKIENEVISEPTKPEEAEKPNPIEETVVENENKPEEKKEEKQNDDQIATTTTTTTIQDGNYYIKLHDQSCVEINVLCKEYEKYVDENDEQNRVLNEEVQGQIQAAIGKGQLLINQKLKQFKGLCLKNIREKTTEVSELKEGEFVTRDEDLAGFWDLVSIQVEDIRSMFDKLSTLRSTGWKLEAPVKKPAAKKPISTTKTDAKPMNGMKQTAASKARAEAAKQRLLEAKKLAAAKQQQPTE